MAHAIIKYKPEITLPVLGNMCGVPIKSGFSAAEVLPACSVVAAHTIYRSAPEIIPVIYKYRRERGNGHAVSGSERLPGLTVVISETLPAQISPDIAFFVLQHRTEADICR